MALALQKIASSAASSSFSSTSALPRLESARLASVASPISQPWWRSLDHSLRVSASTAAVQASQRRLSILAKAGEGENEETAAADAEGSEPADDEEEGTRRRMKMKALPKQVKHIMNILNDEAKANALKDKELPDIRTGDIIAMRLEVPENKRRVSLIRGIVIAKSNAGINSTFRIRRVLAGVGVEMVFPLYSPNIKELKVVDKRKVRRAKLFYLRDKIARLSTIN